MRNKDYRLLVGGFGHVHQERSKGIERYTLMIPESVGMPDLNRMKADVSVQDSVIASGLSQLPSIKSTGVASRVPSPSWILRQGDTIFAVLEDSDEVASLRMADDSEVRTDTNTANDSLREIKLTEISRVKLPASSGPTHAAIAVDPLLGRHLITADYADGTVCVLPIGEGDVLGSVAQVLHGDAEHHGPLPAQEGPHAHWILPLPDGRVLSTDLGADRIYIHRWEGSRLVRTGFVSLAPGTGPRDMHVLPGPSGEFGESGDWRIAVVDEWGCTVTVLEPVGLDGDDGGGKNGKDDADVRTSAPEKPETEAGDQMRGAGDASSAHSQKHKESEEFWVAQTVSLGGDEGAHPDQAASLVFVPDALRGDGVSDDNADGARSAVVGGSAVPAFSRGFVYVGLRGSDRIVTLYWDGGKLARLAPIGQPGWKGRGISSGGKRPRHIAAIGNMLIAANEVSDDLSLFRVAEDGEPVHIGDYPAGSPTVVLPVEGI